MAGPARDDRRVRVRAGRRVTAAARWPGTAALAVLTGIALAGCGRGAPAGGTAAGSHVSSPAPAAVGASPGGTVTGSSNSWSKGPDATVTPGPDGTGAGPGCAPWPAGSTSSTLLLTQASNGRTYCVRTGQTVQVYLSGTLSLRAGSEPPRLTGTGLVPAPARQADLLRSPAASYRAVRTGQAVLTVVRLPCHSVRPQDVPPAGAAGAGALGGLAGTSGNAVLTACTGGAPVGAQCAGQQALRVVVTVR